MASPVGLPGPSVRHDSRSLPFGLLGSVELQSASFSPLLDWKSVLKQVDKEQPLYEFCETAGSGFCPPRLKQWRDEIERLRPLPPRVQIRELNRFANRIAPYARDRAAFGMRDHWASPLQFLQNSGDCEDYAALKFFSLLELGFAEKDLRIAVVRDRKRKILHAVATVSIGKDILVLDNLFDHPVAHHHMLHYVPIYSFNRTTQWAHIVTPDIRARFLDHVVAGLTADKPKQTKHPFDLL